jgi:hypothetical protein
MGSWQSQTTGGCGSSRRSSSDWSPSSCSSWPGLRPGAAQARAPLAQQVRPARRAPPGFRGLRAVQVFRARRASNPQVRPAPAVCRVPLAQLAPRAMRVRTAQPERQVPQDRAVRTAQRVRTARPARVEPLGLPAPQARRELWEVLGLPARQELRARRELREVLGLPARQELRARRELREVLGLPARQGQLVPQA